MLKSRRRGLDCASRVGACLWEFLFATMNVS